MATATRLNENSQVRVQQLIVLNSWKEIAAYLGRGVRTAQRWENELMLPIRRPRGKTRSPVMAFPADLDKWLKQIPGRDVNSASKRQSSSLDDQQRQWARLLAHSRQLLQSLSESSRELRTAVGAISETVMKSCNARNITGND